MTSLRTPGLSLHDRPVGGRRLDDGGASRFRRGLPETALRPGDELLGWRDDWTDVPLRVVKVRGPRVTVVTAQGAVPGGDVLHVGVRRGLRLALSFGVADRRPAGDGMALELLELDLLRAVDLSARRHERRDEGGRPVRLAAAPTDVRPGAAVRLLDRSATGVRFRAAGTLDVGDRVVLRDGDEQLELVVVRRMPRAFGRAEYGCELIAAAAPRAAV